MIGLPSSNLSHIAVIGAHCDDVAIGAGATLLEITRQTPGVVVHALVLTGGGTDREIEVKNAFAAICGQAEVRLTVCELPHDQLSQHRDTVKQRLADFRGSCEPDVVFAPHSAAGQAGRHQDHRVVAELAPTQFRDHLVFGYEILKWPADLAVPSVYLPIPVATARRKAAVLRECYPSQAGCDWFDDEALLGLMRVRGVQCRTKYAEAFHLEEGVLEVGRLYSAN